MGKGKLETENVPRQVRQMGAFADCWLNNKKITVPSERNYAYLMYFDVHPVYRPAVAPER